MMDDILATVREDILSEDKKSLPWVPKHLDKTWEMQAGITGALAGIWAGLAFGAHMGLAGPWGAIAGTVPCAIVGGVIGYLTGAKIGSNLHRDKPFLTDAGDWSAPVIPAAATQAQRITGDSRYPNGEHWSYCANCDNVFLLKQEVDTCPRCKRRFKQ